MTTVTMPDTWPGFVEQVSAMFGGKSPKPEAETVVLAVWAVNALAVWNAALSVAAELAGGRVEFAWPALVGRCGPLAQAAARSNRKPRYENAPSGQTDLPQRVTSAEKRAQVLAETGAAELLARLKTTVSYRPTLGRPSFEPSEPLPQTVELDAAELAEIEVRRQTVLALLRPADPGPEPA